MTHPTLPVSKPFLRYLPVAIIIFAVVAAYSNSFNGQFVMDDGNNIYQNSSINNFWDSFTPPETVNIFRRQAVNVTLAVNYAISRHEVWSYHLFNLCFHLLAALALFGIVKQIFLLQGEKYRKHSPLLAAFTASIWATHPIQTQSVTYIIQRCESLSGLCVLLILLLSIHSMKASSPWPWRIGAMAAFLIGIFVKESIFIAPILVLFFDSTLVSGKLTQAIKKHRALYAIFAVCLIIQALNIASYVGSDSTSQIFSPSPMP